MSEEQFMQILKGEPLIRPPDTAKKQPELLRAQAERAGIIRFQSSLMKQILPEVTFEDCDTQRQLRQKGIFEALHKALQLPESFTVHFIWAERMGRLWAVLVESPDLPEVEEETNEYPEIYACYESVEGKPRLCRLQSGDWVLEL